MPTFEIVGSATTDGVTPVSSLAITTSKAIYVNDTCVLAYVGGASTAVSSITDAGSSWSKTDGTTSGAGDDEIWSCQSHAILASGSTVTVNFGSTILYGAVYLFRTGLNTPVDSHGSAAAVSGSPSASTSGSVGIGTLLFGCASGAHALTQPGGIWVSDYLANSFAGNTGANFAIAHAIATSAGVESYSPSMSSGSNGAVIVGYTPPILNGRFFALM